MNRLSIHSHRNTILKTVEFVIYIIIAWKLYLENYFAFENTSALIV